MATIIISVIVLAAAGLAVRSVIKNRNSCASCPGGCGGCDGKPNCAKPH